MVGAAALCTLVSACSSTPTAARHVTTSSTLGTSGLTRPSNPANPSNPVTTIAPTSTTAPKVPSATVEVEIAGGTALVQFVSSTLNGDLTPTNPAFIQANMVFTFTVQGVNYSGPPQTTSAGTSGLITQVVVTSSNGGVTVEVKLSAPASHYAFGQGHNQVGVTLS